MSNTLGKLWKLQGQFEEKFYAQKHGIDFNHMTHEQKIEATEAFVLGLYEEVNEVRRSSVRKFDKANLLEELVDVAKYDFAIGNLWGYNYQQFYDAFITKSRVVNRRYDIKI